MGKAGARMGGGLGGVRSASHVHDQRRQILGSAGGHLPQDVQGSGLPQAGEGLPRYGVRQEQRLLPADPLDQVLRSARQPELGTVPRKRRQRRVPHRWIPRKRNSCPEGGCFDDAICYSSERKQRRQQNRAHDRLFEKINVRDPLQKLVYLFSYTLTSRFSMDASPTHQPLDGNRIMVDGRYGNWRAS